MMKQTKSKPPNHRQVFNRLCEQLNSGELRKRQGLTKEELAALGHMLKNSGPNSDMVSLVKEIWHQASQEKNPDWFE